MFHFDWTINIGTICSILFLIATIINYGRKTVSFLSRMTQRVDVMWEQFVMDHPEKNFGK